MTGKRIALVVLVVAVALTAGLVSYFTPLMSVRTVTVSGNSAVSQQEITDAASIAKGTPLMQVDTNEAATRVAQILRVESARVRRSYPSKVEISIVERAPVFVVGEGQASKLVDKDGVLFADGPGPQGIPSLTTISAGPQDAATGAAITVITSLPATLRARVVAVKAESPVNIILTLKDRRTVVWGDAEKNDQKARTLGYLLPRKASQINVSSPDHPSFR